MWKVKLYLPGHRFIPTQYFHNLLLVKEDIAGAEMRLVFQHLQVHPPRPGYCTLKAKACPWHQSKCDKRYL